MGAIATQSWGQSFLGIDGLKLLESGLSAQEAVDKLIADDPSHAVRQLGIVDAQDRVAAHTGADCVDWAGHKTGDGFTVQGNRMMGAATIDAMAEAAAGSEALPCRSG